MDRIRKALADLMGGLCDTTANGIIWKEFVNRLEGLTCLLQNPKDIADWLNARPELLDGVIELVFEVPGCINTKCGDAPVKECRGNGPCFTDDDGDCHTNGYNTLEVIGNIHEEGKE
ncbi:MAG: hypothetical protein FWB85_07850 [Chitinispirillia bacterium]|nr:hypothetical protein [Chitinispirillia bacterium]MCL2242178.1 hypothetical protein [Chitinispirillia bacterium]